MSARTVNVILGIWLFLSAFLWSHTAGQLTNTWICGALCTGIALISMPMPNARYLNTGLSLWLFVSAFAIAADNVGTVWNNSLVAVAVFIASLVETPTSEGLGSRRTPMQPV
jgi:hypothetical protein